MGFLHTPTMVAVIVYAFVLQHLMFARASSLCPAGVEQVDAQALPPPPSQTPQSGNQSASSGFHIRRPARFAEPLQLGSPVDASSNGTWSSTGQTWQLCIQAPRDADSLEIIFGRLILPVGSKLIVESDKGAKQTYTSFDGNPLGFRKASKPLPGSFLLLTYQASPTSSKPLSLHIDAILQINSTRSRSFFSQFPGTKSYLLNGSATGADVPMDSSLENVGLYQAVAINASITQIGASMSCLQDAACYSPARNATLATVMLLLLSQNGGRVCTGTLVAGPDPTDQLIMTANHCREEDDDLTIATLWSVVFDDGNTCPSGNQEHHVLSSSRKLKASGDEALFSLKSTSDVPSYSISPSQILQGLEVIFADEKTDIMILRLRNQIPANLKPIYLGWDATGKNFASNGSFTVQHPLGDRKKIAISSVPISPSPWVTAEDTHYLVNWGKHGGGTQDGSSGASLVDEKSGDMLGMLTGGTTFTNCSGNRDLFGSLAYAWESADLWKVLSPDGPNVNRKMSGYIPYSSGPGLIVMPDDLHLDEQTEPREIFQVGLSDRPLPGEKIFVSLGIRQFPDKNQVPVTLLTKNLTFTFDNWDVGLGVDAITGNSSAVALPLPFEIHIVAISSMRQHFVQRRVIKGIRTDSQLLPGWSLEDPIVLSENSNGLLSTGDLGLLAPRNVTIDSAQVKMGSKLAAANPLGTSVFFNLTASRSLILDMQACGMDSWLQVVIYNNSRATWSSRQPCKTMDNPTCLPIDNAANCSGFSNLQLPSLSVGADLPPYTIAVSSLDGTESLFSFQVTQSSVFGAGATTPRAPTS